MTLVVPWVALLYGVGVIVFSKSFAESIVRWNRLAWNKELDAKQTRWVCLAAGVSMVVFSVGRIFQLTP